MWYCPPQANFFLNFVDFDQDFGSKFTYPALHFFVIQHLPSPPLSRKFFIPPFKPKLQKLHPPKSLGGWHYVVGGGHVHFVQGTAKLAKWTKKVDKKVDIFCFLSVFCKLYIIELSVGPTKCSEQLNTYCKHKIYFIGPLYTKFPNSVFKYFFSKKKFQKSTGHLGLIE